MDFSTEIGLLCKSTVGGWSCAWYPDSDGKTGWKAYRERHEAHRAYKMQKYLHKHGMAPEVTSSFVGFIFKDSHSVTRWGYQTVTVDVAHDMMEKYRVSDLVSVHGWRKYRDEFDWLVDAAGQRLLEDVWDHFDIWSDDSGSRPHFDLHRSNWGFGESSNPLVLDTGWHFYHHVPDAFQPEVFGEYLDDEEIDGPNCYMQVI